MATPRTFKIQRTNETDLIVVGEIIAESAGWRYYMRIVKTPAGAFVLVIGDQIDEWQTAHHIFSRAGLVHTLSSFKTEPLVPSVRSLVSDWPDDVNVRRDLLQVADQAIHEIVDCAERVEQ